MGCGEIFDKGTPQEILRRYSAHSAVCDLGLEQKRWREAREEVLKRDGYRCVRCGSTEELHVHHILERRKGGEHKLGNLITLCRRCHQKEHPFPLTEERKVESVEHNV
jgi:5-methylcytosine-specific restriction endonuclease McrA